MLRVHFTGDDLAGLRMAARPDALWETVLSFHRLRDKQAESVYGEWRAETRSRLQGETRLLAPLIPARGYFPDFLTPAEGSDGCDAGLEALRATPPARLHAEVSRLAAGRSLPSWVADLGQGAERSVGRLVDALRAYHRAAVAPYWPQMQTRLEADRALRGRALLDGGAAGLLAALPPGMRWRPPVLEADYPVDRDVHLRGRGLLLLPSFFCRRTPVALCDPALPPVLVYPMEHAPLGGPPAPHPDRAGGDRDRAPGTLGRLVGHTRSAVLQMVGGGCTTSELARRVGVSPASASQHATVLREAGLVHTLRRGSTVLHTLTPLGAALLRGGRPAWPAAGSGRPVRRGAVQSSMPERSTPATM
ncbi:helix-turn-helix domain-containing protein [Streptomyces sp. B1866]|uniref:ArsR/SmtB family transcription factor n=1 Tax=Streptomyces sp. B1866 TaxID=3075431 RepID=UPI0028910FC9|nr:helix-turn-helix domain-containing protein [Streptomyces sp. B1866]MDT3398316.1 helix-turn-helix domain-containing protein [Streptomyces sp. B1866]